MKRTKLFGVFDPFSVMSDHDLNQEASRLRRANRKLRRAIHRLADEEEGDSAEFTLSNPASTPRPWRGGEPQNTRQAVLLTGMDCQPGQQDLFQTDREAAVVLDGATLPVAATSSRAGCRW